MPPITSRVSTKPPTPNLPLPLPHNLAPAPKSSLPIPENRAYGDSIEPRKKMTKPVQVQEEEKEEDED